MYRAKNQNMLLSGDDSALCVVDAQERLLPAVRDPGGILRSIKALITAAERLGILVLFTEHCADAIGHTVADLLDHAADARVIHKSRFCATDEEALVRAIRAAGRRQVVLAGTESHVCVLQTGLGLVAEGFDVFFTADAMASRAEQDHRFALERARDQGARIVTTEMVLFEWLADGRSEKFRELLPVIKRLKDA